MTPSHAFCLFTLYTYHMFLLSFSHSAVAVQLLYIILSVSVNFTLPVLCISVSLYIVSARLVNKSIFCEVTPVHEQAVSYRHISTRRTLATLLQASPAIIHSLCTLYLRIQFLPDWWIKVNNFCKVMPMDKKVVSYLYISTWRALVMLLQAKPGPQKQSFRICWSTTFCRLNAFLLPNKQQKSTEIMLNDTTPTSAKASRSWISNCEVCWARKRIYALTAAVSLSTWQACTTEANVSCNTIHQLPLFNCCVMKKWIYTAHHSQKANNAPWTPSTPRRKCLNKTSKSGGGVGEGCVYVLAESSTSLHQQQIWQHIWQNLNQYLCSRDNKQ